LTSFAQVLARRLATIAAIGTCFLCAAALAQPGPLPAGVYEGHYTAGFETSSFTPVGSKNERWWLSGNLAGTGQERADNDDPVRNLGPIYLKVKGRLSPEGRYGHLGGYRRELVVERVLEVRRPDPASLFAEAQRAEKDGAAKDAVRIYRRLARAGDKKAALALGDIYKNGRPGVPRDFAESLQWYDLAQKLGSAAGSQGNPH
jgi:hypothetical protein